MSEAMSHICPHCICLRGLDPIYIVTSRIFSISDPFIYLHSKCILVNNTGCPIYCVIVDSLYKFWAQYMGQGVCISHVRMMFSFHCSEWKETCIVFRLVQGSRKLFHNFYRASKNVFFLSCQALTVFCVNIHEPANRGINKIPLLAGIR